MLIKNKSDFHQFVNSVKIILSSNDISIKTKKLEELLSKSYGFQSSNGLHASIPCNLELTEDAQHTFFKLLQTNHPDTRNLKSNPLAQLVDHLDSYSVEYKSDEICFPKYQKDNETYWYLMKKGWISSKDVEVNNLIPGINVFKVVLDVCGSNEPNSMFFGAQHILWDSYIASYDAEHEMLSLEQLYGELPK
ncbi:hypothetical protein [Aliivibrio fischeri]|uniref:hypothetical protein n=1 Tax=Aliivibrio fischeri TaxID=668 RepID=UPI00080EDD0F|nr:hypothetical protein [Aliivibrio fischeri]OCH05842.1 hypothetical protein A6E09_18035 [Aliivibrio fischeri]